MYLDYYHLKEKPFQITCDPKYLWSCEKHQEALAMLRYGILDNRGFLLLTGEVGTGKTLLVHQLLTMLPEDAVVAIISDPNLHPMDFYRLVGDGFGLSAPIESKSTFLIQLREFLQAAAEQKKSVALIVDEAQRLSHHLMEEIRALSNIELPDRKLINIFLIGQPELNTVLSREENRALSQRFTLRYHIDPLTIEETAGYILHRLEVAGGSEKIFTDSAIDKIFAFTAGIPRLINILCDHALLTGSVSQLPLVDAEVIDQCAQELSIPSQQKSIGSFRFASNTADANSDHVASGSRSTGKEAARTAVTELPAPEQLDASSIWSGALKWAPLGVLVLIAIFLSPSIFPLKEKTTQSDNKEINQQHRPKAEGLADASNKVQKEENLPPSAAAPDTTGRQDQAYAAENSQDRASLQVAKPDHNTDDALHHPGPPVWPNSDETFVDIDDVSESAYSTNYNEDK